MQLNLTPRLRRSVAIGAGTVTALAGLSVWGINAASAAGEKPLDIVLGVGATQTEKVVSWYYPTGAQQAIEISEGDTFSSSSAKKVIATSAPNTAPDTQELYAAKKLDGTPETLTNQSGYYNAHVALHDLKPNTKYTYHVGAADGSSWSSDYTFFTGTASSDFTFAAFGDPQIGSSGYTHNDGRGWAKTLDYIAKTAPQTELLVSTGDQVEHANDEFDWSNWADPDNSAAGDGSSISPVLKEITYAPAIGNHEGAYSDKVGGVATAAGRAYNQHFAPPNEDDNALFTRTSDGGTTANRPGGNYWYTYKDVLFIDINSNAYADQAGGNADAAHAAYIKDVIAKHGQGTKWQIVVFHHAIYSPADHANDADNSQRRKDLTYTMSQEGVDLVIQGHDHAYSRSYELKATAPGQAPVKAKQNEQPGARSVTTGPGGVIYVTADSASGSKYYDLTAPDPSKNNGDYGPDTLPGNNDANQTRHWANSVESQQYTPTYIQVKVTNAKLSVSNIATQDYTAETNSAVFTKKTGQRINPATGTAYTDDQLAALGDQRPGTPDIHHLQKEGAISDQFDLTGGNTNAFPPQSTRTVTITVPGQTVVQQVVPARVRGLVASRIKTLTKQIKKAKGARKAKLKAQLAVYRSIQKQLG